ncbi:MAG TPA: tripartite tricarboxylate transporter substrate binding protein [Paenalcaligenes sp.]|nr:tripartite tricarboxylate transporter substrate binding protein [Paenalcaligenes sp.]
MSVVVIAAPYPHRPISLVVTFPPGGGTDLLARKLSERLADYLPEPVIVENKPGASGNIGARQVAQALPDGHTLLMVNSTYAINPGFYAEMGFDPERDLVPVVNIAWVPSVWVAHPDKGPKNLAEALALAQQKAGIQYGSCGAGTPQHLAAEMLRVQTAVNLMHVPYNGCGPAVNDVLAGHVGTAFVTLSSAVPYIKQGDLRALAVTSAERTQALPTLPTVAEQIEQSFDVSQWHAVFAPAKTPATAIEYLRTQIERILAKPKMQADLKSLGYELAQEKTADFEKIVRTDLQRYKKLANEIQVKPTE